MNNSKSRTVKVVSNRIVSTNNRPSNDIDKLTQIKLNRAIRHYNKQLIIKCGLAPWLKLMDISRLNRLKAVQHFDYKLIKNLFGFWYDYVILLKRERIRHEQRLSIKATNYYRYQLTKRIWIYWAKYRKQLRSKAKFLSKYHSYNLILRYSLKAWKLSYQRELIHHNNKLNQIIPRGRVAIKRFYWRIWLTYIENVHIEKEANYRTNKAWSKLKDWINTENIS
mmetsp:Transcript_23403/g.21288  ORF Transcript_23403/g.21288 Transcript_23403/m.21288 type:complete len:223 (+) Transcript_23403:31-699(+)